MELAIHRTIPTSGKWILCIVDSIAAFGIFGDCVLWFFDVIRINIQTKGSVVGILCSSLASNVAWAG